MVDRHEEPPAAGEEARVRDAARGGRDDGRSRGRGDVDSAVKPVSPGAGPVRRAACDRRRERDRDARRRQAERGKRGRARDGVRREAGEALEADERCRRAPSEGAVDRPAGEPVRGERELQREDIRAARAGRERPRPERAQGEDAPRLRADDAVDGDSRARLRGADSGLRVAGPVTPSIAPSYSPRERSVAWSAAVAGSPAACAGTTPKTNGSAASRTFARMKRRFAAAAWIPRPPPLTRFEPCDGPSLTLARAAAAAGSETGRGTVAFYFGTFLQASAAWWCCSFSAARWA